MDRQRIARIRMMVFTVGSVITAVLTVVALIFSGTQAGFVSLSRASSALGVNFTSEQTFNFSATGNEYFPSAASVSEKVMTGGNSSVLHITVAGFNTTGAADSWYSHHTAVLISSEYALYNDSYKGYVYTLLVSHKTGSLENASVWGIGGKYSFFIFFQGSIRITNGSMESLTHGQVNAMI